MSGLRARLAAITAAGILITAAPVPAALASVTQGAGVTGTVSGLSSLTTIACPTSSACAALGQDGNGNAKSAIINATTGTAKAWSGKLASQFMNAIACPSATGCLAVADDVVVTVKPSTGAMKVAATLKPPAGDIVAMGAMACAGTTDCYAAGFQGTPAAGKAIVVHLSAAGKVLSRNIVTGTGIGAIACPSSSICLVSDHFASSGAEQIRLLDHGKLSASSHTFPAKTFIQRIACFRASLCYALGGVSTTTGSPTDEMFPLNPKTGAIGAVVKLSKFSGTGLACSSATRCLVVGFTGSGAAAKPGVVVVSGGKPGSPATLSGTFLSDVACATSSLCYAVGAKGNDALVEKA